MVQRQSSRRHNPHASPSRSGSRLNADYIIPDESRPVFGLVVTISIKPVVLFGGTDTPPGPIREHRLYVKYDSHLLDQNSEPLFDKTGIFRVLGTHAPASRSGLGPFASQLDWIFTSDPHAPSQ